MLRYDLFHIRRSCSGCRDGKPASASVNEAITCVLHHARSNMVRFPKIYHRSRSEAAWCISDVTTETRPCAGMDVLMQELTEHHPHF